MVKETRLYDLLGVPPDADLKAIRRGYHTQSLRTHPDRHPPEEKKSAEEQFKLVSNAFEILSDPKKRRLYDRGGMQMVLQCGGDGAAADGDDDDAFGGGGGGATAAAFDGFMDTVFQKTADEFFSPHLFPHHHHHHATSFGHGGGGGGFTFVDPFVMFDRMFGGEGFGGIDSFLDDLFEGGSSGGAGAADGRRRHRHSGGSDTAAAEGHSSSSSSSGSFFFGLPDPGGIFRALHSRNVGEGRRFRHQQHHHQPDDRASSSSSLAASSSFSSTSISTGTGPNGIRTETSTVVTTREDGTVEKKVTQKKIGPDGQTLMSKTHESVLESGAKEQNQGERLMTLDSHATAAPTAAADSVADNREPAVMIDEAPQQQGVESVRRSPLHQEGDQQERQHHHQHPQQQQRSREATPRSSSIRRRDSFTTYYGHQPHASPDHTLHGVGIAVHLTPGQEHNLTHPSHQQQHQHHGPPDHDDVEKEAGAGAGARRRASRDQTINKNTAADEEEYLPIPPEREPVSASALSSMGPPVVDARPHDTSSGGVVGTGDTAMRRGGLREGHEPTQLSGKRTSTECCSCCVIC